MHFERLLPEDAVAVRYRVPGLSSPQLADQLYCCVFCGILLPYSSVLYEVDFFSCAQCASLLAPAEAAVANYSCPKCFGCPDCGSVLGPADRLAPGGAGAGESTETEPAEAASADETARLALLRSTCEVGRGVAAAKAAEAEAATAAAAVSLPHGLGSPPASPQATAATAGHAAPAPAPVALECPHCGYLAGHALAAAAAGAAVTPALIRAEHGLRAVNPLAEALVRAGHRRGAAALPAAAAGGGGDAAGETGAAGGGLAVYPSDVGNFANVGGGDGGAAKAVDLSALAAAASAAAATSASAAGGRGTSGWRVVDERLQRCEAAQRAQSIWDRPLIPGAGEAPGKTAPRSPPTPFTAAVAAALPELAAAAAGLRAAAAQPEAFPSVEERLGAAPGEINQALYRRAERLPLPQALRPRCSKRCGHCRRFVLHNEANPNNPIRLNSSAVSMAPHIQLIGLVPPTLARSVFGSDSRIRELPLETRFPPLRARHGETRELVLDIANVLEAYSAAVSVSFGPRDGPIPPPASAPAAAPAEGGAIGAAYLGPHATDDTLVVGIEPATPGLRKDGEADILDFRLEAAFGGGGGDAGAPAGAPAGTPAGAPAGGNGPSSGVASPGVASPGGASPPAAASPVNSAAGAGGGSGGARAADGSGDSSIFSLSKNKARLLLRLAPREGTMPSDIAFFTMNVSFRTEVTSLSKPLNLEAAVCLGRFASLSDSLT